MKIVGVGNMGSRFAAQFRVSPFNSGFKTIAIGTQKKCLDKIEMDAKLFIGEPTFYDRGTRGDPQVGDKFAEQHSGEIAALFEGTDRVFLVAGGGDGTGSGATPVVARIAKEVGVKSVVALMTFPFEFEGAERKANVQTCLKKLKASADHVLAFSSDRLYSEGIMRSVSVPEPLADMPGDRFVLGNELHDFESRSRRANERLMQILRLLMDDTTDGGVERIREALIQDKASWLGMGGSTVGQRGLFEALGRALNWSLVDRGDVLTAKRLDVVLHLGEDRSEAEIAEIPKLTNGLLGRQVETMVHVRYQPQLMQRSRLTLVGL
jgi:cell division GTPase FtsZ